MTSKNTLVVMCHPRADSLTAAVAQSIIAGLKESQHKVEYLDLYQEQFDPRLMSEDEPDWEDMTKAASSAVLNEIHRIQSVQSLVLVFPVWWWGMPAMLEGWIERVWTYGFAYGEGCRLPIDKVLGVGLAANAEEDSDSQAFYQGFTERFEKGICQYCGVEQSQLILLYESLSGGETAERLIKQAYMLGQTF